MLKNRFWGILILLSAAASMTARAGVFFPQDTIKACGLSYTLSAPAGLTGYSWNTGASTQSITTNRTGWYSVSAIQNGTRVSDSVFLNLLYVNIKNNDTTICPGNSVVLNSETAFNFSCTGYPAQQYSTWTSIGPLGVIYKWNNKYYIRTVSDVLQSNNLNGPWTSMGFGTQTGILFNPAELLGVDATGRLHVGTTNNGQYVYNNGTWTSTGGGGLGTAGQFFTLLSTGRIIISKSGALAGVWYSDDNGNTWVRANSPASTWLSFTVANDGTIFAVGSSAPGGVIKSTDNGLNWTSINSQLGGITSATGISKDCNGTLWLVADRMFYRSNDNGVTWVPVLPIPGLFTSNPVGGSLLATSNGEIYYFGVLNLFTQGLFVTRDGGQTWTPVTGFPGTLSYLKEIDGQLIACTTTGVYALTLQPVITLQWSTGATTPSITVSPTQTTTYYLTASNGVTTCIDSITVSTGAIYSSLFSQDTIYQCGSSVTVSAPNGYTSYQWNNGATTRSITVTEPGLLYVQATPQTGCPVFDSIYVNLLDIHILNNDTTVCPGDSVELTIDPGDPLVSTCFDPKVIVGGNSSYGYTPISVDNAGNYLLGGAFSGVTNIAGVTVTSFGGQDIFLSKYDSCGNPLWVITGGSSASGDTPGEITTDAAGNIYYTGRYNQPLTLYGTNGIPFFANYTTTSNAGHQDGFVVKLNAAGEILWGATIQGASNDGFGNVTIDNNNCAIVTGGFNGCCPSSFTAMISGPNGSVAVNSFGSSYGSGVMVKFDPAGNILWKTTLHNRDLEMNQTAVDAQNNIYVVGGFNSWNFGTPAQFIDANGANNSLFNPGIGLSYLVKLNSNGAWQWGVTYGNEGNGVGSLIGVTDVKTDAAGNPWVCGYYSGTPITFYSTSATTLTQPAAANNTGYIAKYSTAGVPLLSNTLQQSDGYTILTGLSLSGSNIGVTGYYSGSTNLGGADGLLAFYDQNAGLISTTTAGGGGDDILSNITYNGSNYVVGGSTTSAPAVIDGVNVNGAANFLWNATSLTNGNNTILWSTGDTTPTITVHPLQTTTYYVSVSNGFLTCRDSVKVTVNNLNSNFFAQDTISICGTSYNLTAPSGYSAYQWNTGEATATINASSTGWYSCTVFQGNCSATDSVFLSIVQVNIINNDTTICSGDSVILTAVNPIPRPLCDQLPLGLNNGLVGWYPFCGNANDESGNGNDGNILGANLTLDRFGNINQAFEFDGINDFIEVPDNIQTQLLNTDFTINAWVFPSNNNWGNIWYKGQSAGNNFPKYFFSRTNGRFEFHINGPGLNTGLWAYSNNSSLTSWQMGTMVKQGSSIFFYLNASPNGSPAWNYPISNTAGFNSRIGGAEPNGTGWWNGKIDDVGLWNRALAPSEIDKLYNWGIPNIRYLWSTGDTTETIRVSPAQTTNYYCTVSNGITSCTDSVKVTVSQISNVNAGSDTLICSDSTIQLSCNGVNGYWTVTGSNAANVTIQNINNPHTIISVSGYCDAYDLVWHETNGACERTDTVTIGFEEPPVDPGTVVCPKICDTICGRPPLSINPGNTSGPICSISGICGSRTPALTKLRDSLCRPDTLIVITPPTCHWTWTYVGDVDSIPPTDTPSVTFFPDSLTANAIAQVSEYGEYSFDWVCTGGTYSGGGGSGNCCGNGRIIKGKKTFKFFPIKTPTFPPIAPVCLGGTFNLPPVSNEGMQGTWSPAINNTATTTYTFTPASTYLCPTTAQLTVTVNNPITPTFFIQPFICQGNAAFLPNISNEGVFGNWSPSPIATASGAYFFTPAPGQCASPYAQFIFVNPTYNINLTATTCANQSYVLPWGATATTTGNYSYSYISQAGCDSIINVNLTVNQATNSSTTQIACDSLRWNGTRYTTSGTFVYNYYNANGCESADTLHLTISTGRDTAYTLNTCDSLRWNGTLYTSSGDYTYNFSNGAGCSFTDTLHLTVNTGTYTGTIQSTCDSLRWNGILYTTSGTYLHNYNNSFGCASVDTLNLTVNIGSFINDRRVVCDSIRWNGSLYTTSGTYLHNYNNSFGCASVDTLQLTVNSGSFGATTEVVCDSIRWNGILYTTSGNYTFNYLNSFGCASTDTLHVTVNFGSFNTNTQEACDSLAWNGTHYTASGDYTYDYTNSLGCRSTDTLHLTIRSGSFNAFTQSACDTLTWNGTVYNTAGTYLYNYQNSYGCNSTDTLHLSVNTGTFTAVSESYCDSLRWNGMLYTASGTYQHNYNNSFGCASVDTLYLTINQGSFNPVFQTVCDSLRWNGTLYTTSGVYLFNYQNGFGCASTDTLHLTVNRGINSVTTQSACDTFRWNGNLYNSPGSYTYSYADPSGCLITDTLHLTINTGTFATSSQSACDSFRWNNVLYTTTGVYTFDYNNSFGCASTDTLKLLINTGTYTSNNTSACVNYTWYNNNYTSSGTYLYSYNNNFGCTSVDTLNLQINPAPALGQDKYLRICFGETASLQNLFNTGSNAYTWTYNQAPVDNPAAVSSAGVYFIIVTDNNGCSDTARVLLGIQPPVTAYAGPDITAETGQPFALYGTGGIACSWLPASLLNNPSSCTPQAIITNDTYFILTAYDEIGCSDTDTIFVRAIDGPEIYIPNSFTPNGDGLNDEFGPITVGITEFDYFRIYNRYGEVVFESRDSRRKWDGRYKGLPQNVGNYIWMIKAKDRTGKDYLRKGNVLLLR